MSIINNNTDLSLQSQHLSQDILSTPGYLENNLSDNEHRFFSLIHTHSQVYSELFYSHAHMAKEMGCSVSSIRRYLNKFNGLGLIKIIHRTYPNTNIYVVNEYFKKDKTLLSKYKSYLALGLLMSCYTTFPEGEQVLRYNEVIKQHSNNITVILGSNRGSEMLQLSDAQAEERKKYPQWAQDRALSIYKRKSENQKIEDHARYFMGILRSEAASQQPYGKRQPVRREASQSVSKNTNKYQPQQTLRYSPSPIIDPKPKLAMESEFNRALTMERAYHQYKINPAMKMAAELAEPGATGQLRELSEEEQRLVLFTVHTKECQCRSKDNF
jgi:hypothetical protein